MLKRLKTGLLTASVLALSTGAALADFELNILHINDFHSRVEEINKYDSTCSDKEKAAQECFGGAARLKTAFEQRRSALSGKNVLSLNAGDNFQGSLFYSTLKGKAELEVMNAIGFDAMTVGNHEFDDGETAILPFLEGAKFPVLGANVKVTPASTLGDRVKPSTVVEVGGQKIGIIGVVTTDTNEIANPGPNVKIDDDVAAIEAEVTKLKAEGVNKIIALTHVGYKRDLDVLAKIADIDVIVGGHSHTLLSNTDTKAEGPYPTFVDNAGGYKVPVVTAASYSKYLGEVTITFDDNGVVKSAKGDPILVDKAFEPDQTVAAMVTELAKPIDELRKKVIGQSSDKIEGDRTVCRAKECSMGNLVADAMLDAAKGQGMTMAIINGGGLRASIASGDVTQGDVISVLPFQNTLATFQLSGADVVKALENGVSQIDDGAGRFPQVAGLKFSFDKSKPAGSRVSDVQAKEGDNFVAIDPAKTYGVVSNNFMRAGGDGYASFKTGAQNAYDYGPDLADVTAAYVGANAPYKPYTDGRITDLTPADYKPAPKADAAPAAPAAAPAPATTAQAPAATPAPTAPAPAAPAATTTAPAAVEAPGQTAQPANGPSKYTVVKGDSLWTIAESAYGDGTRWSEISKANSLRHPNLIQVGKELELPAK
ncbi:5'-nucleotidase C-terminal domain-containing protein [Rhizobium panacihumi]|uniref:5'-nucleotidase C-terminal domain-containing protein n=1 Tax=Rhizobium panacihumi TaxID=2008450 RepID=UPI003D7BED21